MNFFTVGFAAAAGLAAAGVLYFHPGSQGDPAWESGIFTSSVPSGAAAEAEEDTGLRPETAGSGHRPLWQVTRGGVIPQRDYISRFQDRASIQARERRKARSVCIRRGTALACG
jgi:hypothetical protein